MSATRPTNPHPRLRTWLGRVLAFGALLALPGAALADPPAAGAAAKTGVSDDTACLRPWLGVRVGPAPEMLRAQLDRGGLVVFNLVNGGPSDKAGLERYDLILTFNGAPTEHVDELGPALLENGVGKAATMTVLRKGETITLQITPDQAPQADFERLDWKYESPEPDITTRYFGHRLERDPYGAWIFSPLGQLKDLPEPLRDMPAANDPAWKLWQDAIRDAQLDLPTYRFEVDDKDGTLFFYDPAQADADAEVSIRIRVKREGVTTTIERAVDGTIRVEQVNADGQQTATEYPDLDALRKQAPDTYRLYRSYSGYRPKRWIEFVPPPGELDKQQQEYQADMRERLEQIRKNLEQAHEEAARREQAAREQVKQLNNALPDAAEPQLRLKIARDGKITVEQARDGQVEHLEFDDADALRKQNPALYRRLKPMIDELSKPGRAMAPALVSFLPT